VGQRQLDGAVAEVADDADAVLPEVDARDQAPQRLDVPLGRVGSDQGRVVHDDQDDVGRLLADPAGAIHGQADGGGVAEHELGGAGGLVAREHAGGVAGHRERGIARRGGEVDADDAGEAVGDVHAAEIVRGDGRQRQRVGGGERAGVEARGHRAVRRVALDIARFAEPEKHTPRPAGDGPHVGGDRDVGATRAVRLEDDRQVAVVVQRVHPPVRARAEVDVWVDGEGRHRVVRQVPLGLPRHSVGVDEDELGVVELARRLAFVDQCDDGIRRVVVGQVDDLEERPVLAAQVLAALQGRRPEVLGPHRFQHLNSLPVLLHVHASEATDAVLVLDPRRPAADLGRARRRCALWGGGRAVNLAAARLASMLEAVVAEDLAVGAGAVGALDAHALGDAGGLARRQPHRADGVAQRPEEAAVARAVHDEDLIRRRGADHPRRDQAGVVAGVAL